MKKLLFLGIAVLSLSCIGCTTTDVNPDTNMQTSSPTSSPISSTSPSDDAEGGMVTDSNGIIGDSDAPMETN